MWYSAGTVAVTANSATVTGTGTAFSANARVGDAFRGPDGRWYEVTNIASATVLSIKPSYQGATASGQAYAIAPMQGYVKESADRLRQFVDQYGSVLAAIQPWATSATAAAAREALGANDAANLTSGTLPDARVSSTLTADKAFRRGNILGTVSQSGGVPTGAIIERGSNANGEYVRFADGTQICRLDTRFTGGSVVSYLDWTYPATFLTAPFVDAQVELGLGTDPTLFGRSLTYQHRQQNYARIQYKSPSTVTAALVAIGRWY